MESRNPTVHQGLWVAFRSPKVTVPTQHPFFPNPDVQRHPFFPTVSLHLQGHLHLRRPCTFREDVGWPLENISLGESTSKASGDP